ncbi:MAG: GtrA family protein [Arenimonas sp.]
MLIRASKFFLVGALVTGLHLSISYLMVHLGHGLLWANSIAFIVAFFVSYFLQSSITFASGYSLRKFFQFSLVALIALLASQSVAYLCLKNAVDNRWAVLLSGLTPAGISFLLNHFFVFKSNGSS